MDKNIAKQTVFGTGLIYLVDSFDIEQLDTEISSKLIDDNLLACSDEGTTFEETKEVHSTQMAGFNNKKVKAFENVISAEGKITGTGRVLNAKLLELSLYKKDSRNTSETYDVYKPINSIIEEGTYKDVVMVANTKENKKGTIVVLHNVISDNINIETKAADDGSMKFEFTTRYSLDELNVAPYEIIFAKTE